MLPQGQNDIRASEGASGEKCRNYSSDTLLKARSSHVNYELSFIAGGNRLFTNRYSPRRPPPKTTTPKRYQGTQNLTHFLTIRSLPPTFVRVVLHLYTRPVILTTFAHIPSLPPLYQLIKSCLLPTAVLQSSPDGLPRRTRTWTG